MLTLASNPVKVPTFALEPQTKILGLCPEAREVVQALAGFSVFGLLIFPHSKETLGMRTANRHHVSASNVFNQSQKEGWVMGKAPWQQVTDNHTARKGAVESGSWRKPERKVCAPRYLIEPRGYENRASRMASDATLYGGMVFQEIQHETRLRTELLQVMQCRKLSPNVSARLNTGQSETQVERGIV